MKKAVFNRWEDMPQTEMTPQIRRRLISGDHVMVVEFRFDKRRDHCRTSSYARTTLTHHFGVRRNLRWVVRPA
jgi:hypothetical protein